jgi:hypothetical protein
LRGHKTINKQAMRTFKEEKHRVAIKLFLLPTFQRQKKIIFSLRSLRLCGEKYKTILSQYYYSSEYPVNPVLI